VPFYHNVKIHVLELTTIIVVHNMSNVLMCCIVTYIFLYGICTFIFIQSLQFTYKHCRAQRAPTVLVCLNTTESQRKDILHIIFSELKCAFETSKVHMDRVYIRVFIRVSVRTCCERASALYCVNLKQSTH
jgi:hypothetical protein